MIPSKPRDRGFVTRVASATRGSTVACAVTLLCACGATTEPLPTPPEDLAPSLVLQVSTPADTVDSYSAMVVFVGLAPGHPAAGVRVQARALPLDAVPDEPGLTLDDVGRVTSSDGSAVFHFHYGTVSGRTGIEVRVDSLALADTVVIEVLPGTLSDIRFSPRDTTVFVDAAVPFESVAADRYGNARAEAPTLVATSQNFSIDTAAGTMTADHVALAWLRWEVADVTRTDTLAFVPVGAMAFQQSINHVGGPRERALHVSNLDGTNAREVFRTFDQEPAPGPVWSWDGTRLAYQTDSTIWVDDLTGDRVAVATGLEDSYRLSWGGNGPWLYYAHRVIYTGGFETWRAATDGSGAELFSDGLGVASPDGRYLALSKSSGLWLHEIETGAETLILDEGATVWWTSDGQGVMAGGFDDALAQNVLRIYGLDGSILWTGPAVGNPSMSSDGRYILGDVGLGSFGQSGTRIAVVDVETASLTILPVPSMLLPTYPTWRTELLP